MFQCVGLSVSSHVIMFHRGTENRGREKRENGGRKHENAPKMAHNRKRERHKKGTLGNKKRETDRKVEKRATKIKKTCLCRVGSELSLVPAFLWHSIRQEAV